MSLQKGSFELFSIHDDVLLSNLNQNKIIKSYNKKSSD